MLGRPATTGIWFILIVAAAVWLRRLAGLRFENDHARAVPHTERWRREEELYARRAALAASPRALTSVPARAGSVIV